MSPMRGSPGVGVGSLQGRRNNRAGSIALRARVRQGGERLFLGSGSSAGGTNHRGVGGVGLFLSLTYINIFNIYIYIHIVDITGAHSLTPTLTQSPTPVTYAVSINGHPVTQSQSVTRYAHDTLARDTVVLQNWPTLPTPCQAARPLSNIYVPRHAAQALGANRTQTDPRPTPYQPQPTPTDPAAEQVKYMYTRECLHEWFFSPEQPLAIRGYMVVVDPEHPHVYSRAFGSVCTSGCSHLNHARSDGMSHYRPPPFRRT